MFQSHMSSQYNPFSPSRSLASATPSSKPMTFDNPPPAPQEQTNVFDILPYNISRTRFNRDPYQPLLAAPAVVLSAWSGKKTQDFVSYARGERHELISRIEKLEAILLEVVPPFVRDRLLELEELRSDVARLEDDLAEEGLRHTKAESRLHHTTLIPTDSGVWGRLGRLFNIHVNPLDETSLLALEGKITAALASNSTHMLAESVLKAESARVTAAKKEAAKERERADDLEAQLQIARRKAAQKQTELRALQEKYATPQPGPVDPAPVIACCNRLWGEYQELQQAVEDGVAAMDGIMSDAVSSLRRQAPKSAPPSPERRAAPRTVTVALNPTAPATAQQAPFIERDGDTVLVHSHMVRYGGRHPKTVHPDRAVDLSPEVLAPMLADIAGDVARSRSATVVFLGRPWSPAGVHSVFMQPRVMAEIVSQLTVESGHLTSSLTPKITLSAISLLPDSAEQYRTLLGGPPEDGDVYAVDSPIAAAEDLKAALESSHMFDGPLDEHVVVTVGLHTHTTSRTLAFIQPAAPAMLKSVGARQAISSFNTAITTLFRRERLSKRSSHLIQTLADFLDRDVGLHVVAAIDGGLRAAKQSEALLSFVRDLKG
ncbi:Chromosome partition protein Smc [Carpediemonas membranifera]|uniref:Chromosome partition protein Smc n=1 Tax=Carpediemonas membranifera TaxID=201153 RepID=A0A8J6AV21_9EUKA|nr:Chromosome partition protein Smc [Carpediemonas membranifera]|eukprot:KAG9394903.1 Chromosome partition protein Smc [Carpediemonas membranifera]